MKGKKMEEEIIEKRRLIARVHWRRQPMSAVSPAGRSLYLGNY
jgi:hypothetical protein